MSPDHTPSSVAFLGATRGIGRALARLMAERGDRLALLGRDPEEVARSAADLAARARDGFHPPVLRCDLEEPESFRPALEGAAEALGGLDAVVVTAGIFSPQEALEADRELAARLLTVDFTHTVVFLEEARAQLVASGGGKLCALSSVAGERGRKPVVLYGAAKAGLTRYLEGLDHRWRASGLEVVCVKPGFVRTGMTEGLEPPPFAGDPEPVARDILRALDRGKPVVYTPAPWRWVMLLIRHLPRFVMRRVGF